MNPEKLLEEANILNIRINEIYSTSFELKRDLLKQGYYDALLDDIYSPVHYPQILFS